MKSPDLYLVTDAPLPYLLSLPRAAAEAGHPILCFLHGLDEGPPTDIRAALTRHGPRCPGSSPARHR